VLIEDGGLVVGERYGIAPTLLGPFDGLLGGDDGVFYLLKTSLGGVPVMAELAAVVATGRAGAKDGRSGPKVKGRLLFDGVYLQGVGMGVDHGVVAAADVDLVAAKAPLPFGDSAPPEAHLTLHPVALQLEVISCFVEFGDGGAFGGGRGGCFRGQGGLFGRGGGKGG